MIELAHTLNTGNQKLSYKKMSIVHCQKTGQDYEDDLLFKMEETVLK